MSHDPHTCHMTPAHAILPPHMPYDPRTCHMTPAHMVQQVCQCKVVPRGSPKQYVQVLGREVNDRCKDPGAWPRVQSLLLADRATLDIPPTVFPYIWAGCVSRVYVPPIGMPYKMARVGRQATLRVPHIDRLRESSHLHFSWEWAHADVQSLLTFSTCLAAEP